MAETKKTTETKTVKSSETKAVAKTTAKKTTTAAKTVKSVETKAVEMTVAEVKAEVPAQAEKKVDMIKVTLVKSPYGRLEKQTRTLKALGLKKTNSSNIVPDNAATRGMIFVVKHLVSVEKVK